ncbi:MAG: nucleotidyl transferase AbiEii/AbiGii toxin family protein [Rhodospirillales bacterium]|nr:nucleotidyl transferase AbiEii/AbiGii toxin family protein [Rhodospirillales bacterium]
MNDKPSLEELLEVQAYFGLPSPALVEKDWYVVKALAAITAADIAPLRLVFGGGTALSRASKLVRRMSEDIDLKIVGDETPKRSALRRLRDRVTKALLEAGFVFDPENPDHRRSLNESRYTIYQLPYEPITGGSGVLRPEIQIETALWPLRDATVDLSVSSFVAEAYNRPAEVPRIACVSITQTAAEKFVALTRRTAVEIADARGPRDPTLVRHIYDLHMIRDHYDPARTAILAREIMTQDAEEFGNQFPAYRDDPLRETLNAVEALAADPLYAARFEEFMRDMVYGDRADYAACLKSLGAIARHLQD